MRKKLLLVQTHEQFLALPKAAYWLKAENYGGVWVLYSPIILSDPAAIEAEFDKNITALNQAIKQCFTAEDFVGANNYKVQRDALILDKTTKIKESWRALTPEQLEETATKMFAPFFAALPGVETRLESTKEHYEPKDFIDALNSIRKAWFAPFSSGTFEIAWPTAFPDTKPIELVRRESAPEIPPRPVLPVVPEPAKKKGGNPMFTDRRFRELVLMGVDQLGQEMLKYRLNLKGTAKQIAAGIWKHEQAAAKAA